MTAPKSNAPAVVAAQGVESAGFAGLQRNPSTRRLHPEPGSTRALILSELQAGHVLTSLTAWQRFGASRLAADIHALRRVGWPIVGKEITVPCRAGKSTRVVEYRMGADSADKCRSGEHEG